MSRRVVVVQRVLLHYRVEFYEQLRAELARHDVDLALVYGQPSPSEKAKNDSAMIDWASACRNRYASFLSREFVWQPVWKHIRRADLVVVEQASRLMINYPILLRGWMGGFQVAWWGHGANLDGRSASRFGEWLKRRLVCRVDWWFAYTGKVAERVVSAGMERGRVTVVQNAVDTSSMRAARSAIDPAELAARRRALSLSEGPTALFLGSLYASKRLDFLIEAADELRKRLEGFQLIIIGDGPDRGKVEMAARSRPWVRVMGALHGIAMVQTAALADVALNPGLVGLNLLDLFAVGVPTVTCHSEYHGPEFEYLIDGFNGVVVRGSCEATEYAERILAVLSDSEAMAILKRGCMETSTRLTIENMVSNFSRGVLSALNVAKR